MIVIDANLLIYAYDPTCPDHDKAREWLEGIFSGKETAGIPWLNISAFVRVLTTPAVMAKRIAVSRVLAIVDQWLEIPNVRVLAPTERHWALFRQMVMDGAAQGRMITDAEVAALTIEHAGILYTNDRDFARFPGLRWVNPLQKS
ncbi:MAG TPA: TA system VapC family ribonuclease toxin [Terracidiphilus sp.]|nr:TA system VapC family ribonuclease toxin [Terracidiphilus sp.]